jgi:hypothetical protein
LVIDEVLDYFEIKINRGIRGCARVKGRDWHQREDVGLPRHTGIDDACRRILCLRRAIDEIWQRLDVWEMRERKRRCEGEERARGGRLKWREWGRSWAGAPRETVGG